MLTVADRPKAVLDHIRMRALKQSFAASGRLYATFPPAMRTVSRKLTILQRAAVNISTSKLHASAESPALHKTVPFFIAAVVSTACVSNSHIQRVGDGHYRAEAHARDPVIAEAISRDASYSYCKKLNLGTVFDDFKTNETTRMDGTEVVVGITFQCKVVPDPCTAPNVYCTDPQPGSVRQLR